MDNAIGKASVTSPQRFRGAMVAALSALADRPGTVRIGSGRGSAAVPGPSRWLLRGRGHQEQGPQKPAGSLKSRALLKKPVADGIQQGSCVCRVEHSKPALFGEAGSSSVESRITKHGDTRCILQTRLAGFCRGKRGRPPLKKPKVLILEDN